MPVEELSAAFAQPPTTARPWAYWWWVNGNVTEQSIRRDLEQMKAKGFAGLLLFDARGYHDDHLPPPPPKMEFMDPQWRRMLQFSLREAARVGLTVSVNLSSCAGALRGPWPVGDEAPKQLVHAAQQIDGGQRFSAPAPKGDWGKTWEIALLAIRHAPMAPAASAKSAPVAFDQLVDLSDKLDSDGKLDWNAPPGRWTLLRFACTVIPGHENDVDILDAQAVTGHWQRMAQTVISDAGGPGGSLVGKTLTHFYSVSWEGATPTWTLKLPQEFRRRRGYDIIPHLPALVGFVRSVPARASDRKNEDRPAAGLQAERFLRDYHRTLADCFMDNCYGTLRGLCNQSGLKWHSESGGPWNRKLPSFEHADQLAFLGRNDMPQGEFWNPWRGFNRPVAMAAHIYGRPLAAAEAFTHMRPHWTVYPALLKPLADAAFCDGINHFVWHTFTASPEQFGRPGIEYFAGSHLNPNVTWWEQAGAFLAYLARCQLMLRQGHSVVDAMVYTGDRPYLSWGRGEKWSPKPSLTLPDGYSYDLVNTEMLLERVSTVGNRLALPDGMSYRMLVVDLEDQTIPPQALAKILELARAGATVVLGRQRPIRAPGLTGFPGSDEEIAELAAQLWPSASASDARSLPAGQAGVPVRAPGGDKTSDRAKTSDGDKTDRLTAELQAPPPRAVEKGKVYADCALEQVLQAEKLSPDFEAAPDQGSPAKAPFIFTHRRSGRTDIYFVAGSGSSRCTFRTGGRQPEIWDAVTGRRRDAGYRTTGDGRTEIDLDLPKDGSAFIVFARPTTDSSGQPPKGPAWDAAAMTLEGPWTVLFAPGWGAPPSARFDALVSWTDRPEEGIRHFSGRAVYRKSVRLTAAQAGGSVRLQLGEVRHVAEVRVNGRPLGVVWCDPWTADLSGAVREGDNDLEIAVTNLWVNRLIGDAALPEARRLTGTNARRLPTDQHRHVHLRGYLATDPLLPSGLLGPVRIEFGREMATGSP